MRAKVSSRLLLMACVSVILTSVVLVAQSAKPTAARLTEAAKSFLLTLDEKQKAQASFDFADEHRLKWYFTPQQDKNKKSTRKGLRIEGMTAAQKSAVMEMLKVSLSGTGYQQATTIMDLESLLAELEGTKGAMVRNPNWYFVSIFGEPSMTGAWGWRLEGHHLSVNVTLDKGEIISATPMLFGANPAEIKSGPRKGERTLPEIEDLAKELIQSLDKEQNALAKQDKQLPEVKEGQPTSGVGEPVGIPLGELNIPQQGTLKKLIQAYSSRLPGDVAASEWKKIETAGERKIHFAYCIEANKAGKPYTYRVQGPTFVIEFLNTQADAGRNPANHIHSGWRSLPKDFGLTKE